MRTRLAVPAVLLFVAMALSGCLGNQGDVGNKNIRDNGYGMKNMAERRFANDGRNEMNRVDGRQRNGNNIVGLHGNTRMELSDKIAKSVDSLPGIDGAYVMLTDRNAYVAVMQRSGADRTQPGVSGSNRMNMREQDQVTDALKSRIAEQVKAVAPSTANVYVTANPDFLGRMRNYADEVRAGHPIQGFIAEFNALVDRVFPEQSTTR